MLTTTQILSYTVCQMEDYVCECFNDLEVDETEVDRLIATATSGRAQGKQARSALREIYVKMMDVAETVSGAKGAVYAVRECMDSAFVQHLGAHSEVKLLFANQLSNRWRAAMKEYMRDVIENLPKVVATITAGSDDDAGDGKEREMLRTLRWCVAKVKVLNFMFGWRKPEKSYGMLPFMSRSVYSHAVVQLEVIDGSLKEVGLFLYPRRTTRTFQTAAATPHIAHFKGCHKCAIRPCVANIDPDTPYRAFQGVYEMRDTALRRQL